MLQTKHYRYSIFISRFLFILGINDIRNAKIDFIVIFLILIVTTQLYSYNIFFSFIFSIHETIDVQLREPLYILIASGIKRILNLNRILRIGIRIAGDLPREQEKITHFTRACLRFDISSVLTFVRQKSFSDCTISMQTVRRRDQGEAAVLMDAE